MLFQHVSHYIYRSLIQKTLMNSESRLRRPNKMDMFHSAMQSVQAQHYNCHSGSWNFGKPYILCKSSLEGSRSVDPIEGRDTGTKISWATTMEGHRRTTEEESISWGSCAIVIRKMACLKAYGPLWKSTPGSATFRKCWFNIHHRNDNPRQAPCNIQIWANVVSWTAVCLSHPKTWRSSR
jgi:hypothetical protein